jgi:hypothetical protein
MPMKVWFIKKVQNEINKRKKTLKRCKTKNKIQTDKNIERVQNRQQNKNKPKKIKMKFDLRWIIIQNHSEIVIMTITKTAHST